MESIRSKEVGVIARRRTSHCGITNSFRKLDPNIGLLNWRRLFNTRYSHAERQAVEFAALSSTNITAFVNALNVFNDLLLAALFDTDSTIGKHTLGKLGSVLNSTTSRFAKKYPKTFALAKDVHYIRHQSMYSHPSVRSTGKATKRISFRFLNKAKKLLKAALNELSTAGC